MTQSDAAEDNAAWLHCVVRQCERELVRYAQRLLGDAELARDVVQDAFVKLCCEPRANIENGVRPWLFTVCRNRAMDILKKESRMKTLSEDAAQSVSDPIDPTAAIEMRETAGMATRILNTLPHNQREVIRLKVQNDLSYREISQITGLSVSNVGFLIHKGLRTIRDRLT